VKVYYGSDGLPDAIVVLPHIDYKHHTVKPPIPDAHWAFLFENRKLLASAATAGLGRVTVQKVPDDELFHEAIPAALTALRDWNPDRGASKSTQVLNYVRNHFGGLRRVLHQCPGVTSARIGPRRKIPPRQLGTFVLSEVVDEEKASTDPDAGSKAVAAMRNIDRRRKEILTRYLGMASDPAAVPALALQYGLSRERISQLIASAVDGIRSLYGYGGSRAVRPLNPRLWKPRKTDDERRAANRARNKTYRERKKRESQCPG
jgi:hypothetical protein